MLSVSKFVAPDCSRDGLVRMMREGLLELLTHEIDEMLFVSGLGPDPHLPPPA